MNKSSLKLDKILRINLTNGKIKTEPMDKDALLFMGGKGLACFYLLKEQGPQIDPFSPNNKLIFAWGPLMALAPATSRFVVVTKSPLTGTFLDSYCGGVFPAKLRFSLPRYAAIIFEGKAKELTYLKIENGNVELKDAKDLSGKSVSDLYDKFGKDFEIVGIGIAGEKRVRYATISCDRGTHHAGRGGAGAVMGSKNLKCIVARGEPPALPEKVKELRIKYVRKLRESPGTQWAIQSGTAGTLSDSHKAGIMPTKGWKMGRFEGYENIDPGKIQKATKRRVACYNCPLACGYSLELKGKFDVKTLKGPEYETIVMLGPNLGINDLSSIAKLDKLCGAFGIDTISTGNILGWLMRCSEEGIIDYDIEFGNVEKSIEVVENIAYRKDELGNVLADGIKRAVSVYGGGELAAECKGMDYPGYDPRGSVGMALAYATSDRGACHKRSWVVAPTTFWGELQWDFETQSSIVKKDQDDNSLLWSLVICDFASPVYLEDLGKEWLKALGYDYTVDQLKSLGERIWNMVRWFNIREGFDRKDDYLPEIMTKPLGGDGPAKGKNITRKDFEKMLDSYYELRGWDKNGRPKKGGTVGN